MHMFNKVWIGRAVTCLLTVAVFATSFPTLAADPDDPPQSAAPDAEHCVVYHYSDADLTPTLYMWNVSDDATYRVYSDSTAQASLLGSARRQAQGSCCIIPLDPEQLSYSGGTVYVSGQTEGKEESQRVAVSYTREATPSVRFRVYEPRDTVQRGEEAITQSNAGMLKANTGQLTKDKYYVVDVEMTNFTMVQSLTLPIKYDPKVLELTALKSKNVNGVSGYTFDGPVNADEGVFIRPFMIPDSITLANTMGGHPGYGIGIYPDLYYWGATQDTASTSEWRQTPYVNTSTGLIKLEFSREAGPVDISTVNGTSTTRKLVRLYFKCLETPSESENWADAEILHFATTADIPNGVTDQSQQQLYCHIASPNGYTASIQGINLLAPPMSVDSGSLYASSSSMPLTPNQVYDLPTSLSSADQLRVLLEKKIKIYNYTNYGDGQHAYGTLDQSVDDVLVLTPSSDTAGTVRPGNLIRVYHLLEGSASEYTEIAGPTVVDNEGGVTINLGTNKLRPEGDSVYVTVTRSGTESAKVEIPYDAEMSRDVYFKVNSSGYHGESGSPFSKDYEVRAGEQIRVDIYFNHFDDLLAYTFDLRFNSSVVQAADSSFHRLVQDGYITQESLTGGNSCLAAGTDLSGVTVNEEIAYHTWQDYKAGTMTEAETLEIMAALGIESLERLEAIAKDVEIKNSFGNVGWNGGLLFTGPARAPGTNGSNDPGRDEGSLYPYVNNTTGTLRLASASLVNPPLVLDRDGDGYHFLSIYFVAVTSGKPQFEIKGARGSRSNGIETVASTDGTELVLSGPGNANTTASTVCAMPFTAHWEVSGIEETEKTAVIKLANGNAAETDKDATALFLYNGYAFRDPGFTLQGADDTILVDTASNRVDAEVVRYYMADGVRHELPAWENGEELSDFLIPPGEYSAAYELTYEYTDAAGATVTAVRNVYVIFMRGDVNGDGAVNLFDEQMLQDGAANTTDELYQGKTLVEQSTLHGWLMGNAMPEQEYIMPVARSPNALGEGSTDPGALRLWLEFYSEDADPASAMPLDPMELPAGQNVIAVVRYENLSALNEQGLLNMALSFCYDPAYFTLNGFPREEDTDLAFWNEEASALNSEWIGATSTFAATFTDADASDMTAEADTRRVYLQYINNAGITAFDEDSGYLAAFSFKVAREAFDGVNFCWLDYAMTTADGVSYDRTKLLNGTTPFQKPADIPTASLSSAGYSITGVVVSYNAKNPIYYELYRMGGDGEYEGTKTDSGELIPAQTTGTTAGEHMQDFAITGVSDGTYKLVIRKSYHLSYTIEKLSVSGGNVDLTAKSAFNTIVLAAGDVTSDGVIESSDQSLVINGNNYFKNISDALNPETDITGDGVIESSDQSVLLGNYFKSNSDFIFDYSAVT